MKFFLTLIALLVFFSCTKQNTNNYTLIGEEMNTANALEVSALAEKMNDSNSLDNMVVSGSVSDVCKAKGCWMKIDLPNGETMRVTFKDYALFMPQDITGKEVMIHGVASKKEISLEELQHYAKDAGKSDTEIAAIDKPEIQLTFEADGVIIK